MLIAVASRDGKDINEHFGHADLFYLYEVEGDDRYAEGGEAGRKILLGRS